MSNTRVWPRYKTAVALFLIWCCACAFNLTKAVHIDDRAYLAMARAVLEQPRHPLAQSFNWNNTAEPLSAINQPLLFPALLAVGISVAGDNDLVCHGVMAIFTLIAILFFYRLARRFAPDDTVPLHALGLTAAFALGPAFIPAQNLMCDVPMVALWLVFFWALLCPPPPAELGQRYALAAAMAGAACLIKYSSLILLPILVLDLVLKKQYRLLWTLLIPVSILAGWSVYNYCDYGGVHLLQRSGGGGHLTALPNRCVDWLTCLGAVTPFSIITLPYFAAMRSHRRALALCAGVGLAALLWSLHAHGDSLMECLLRAVFLSNGLYLICLAAYTLRQMVAPRNGTTPTPHGGHVNAPRETDAATHHHALILAAWLASSILFVLLFAPFMAVRHVLPVIPAMLLLAAHAVGHKSATLWFWAGVLTTLCVGFALGLADAEYAAVYRQQAPAIRRALPPSARIWYAGHWGWQWYAAQAGLRQYDFKHTHLQAGDYMVVPGMAETPGISAADASLLTKNAVVTVPSSRFTFFRTMLGARGYYAGGFHALPWTFTRQPLENFTIYKVGSLPKTAAANPG